MLYDRVAFGFIDDGAGFTGSATAGNLDHVTNYDKPMLAHALQAINGYRLYHFQLCGRIQLRMAALWYIGMLESGQGAHCW
jgi:hypothetical protein